MKLLKITPKQIILSALFAALTFITTFIIRLPIPATGGYVNLGESMVLLSGFMLGPFLGAFAAGLGCALADMISGYMLYAPVTFILKALVALVAGIIFTYSKKTSLRAVICGIIGEIIMIFGYYLYEAFALGFGSAVAILGVPANIFQAITGIAVSSLIVQVLSKRLNHSNEDSGDPNIENEE